MLDKLSRSLNLKYKNIVQVDNASLKEDNNNTGRNSKQTAVTNIIQRQRIV